MAILLFTILKILSHCFEGSRHKHLYLLSLEAGLAVGVTVALEANQWRRVRNLADSIHGPTFGFYGSPPLPARSQMTDRKITRTYYRGNDDRDESLRDRGMYHTCTMTLRFHGDNRPLDYDSIVSDQSNLSLVVEIRPEQDADLTFYSGSIFKGVFLTQNHGPFLGSREPIDDRASFVLDESSGCWRARYDLGELTKRRAGIVYLCQEFEDNGVVEGSRFHYGIEFMAEHANDRLSRQSDIWMGPLYRSAPARDGRIPPEELLAEGPIFGE